MSNNYNSALQSNNTDLQALINKANALPDAVNIDAELNTQDDLIAQIQAAVDSLPEASGSSGGSASYDTCTLQINNQNGYPYALGYTSVENGKIVAKYSYISGSYSTTSFTCLCGSALCCYSSAGGSLSSSSVSYIGTMYDPCYIYRIDASANETITAYIYAGGGEN